MTYVASRLQELGQRLRERLVERRLFVAGAVALALVFLVFSDLKLSAAATGLGAMVAATALWPRALQPPRPYSSGQTFLGVAAIDTTLPPSVSLGMTGLLEKILAGIPDATVMLNEDARVVAANASAKALLPVAAGRHISQISRAPELLTAVEQARASDQAQTFQMRTSVPVKRLLIGSATPVLDDTVEAGVRVRPSVVLVLRDQTAEQQLVQLRADFVANASHELRTPLASLKGFVETLLGPAKGDQAAVQKFLPIMLAQAERMSRLIDDLLSLSRIEMREHVPPSDAVDLGNVAVEVVKAMQLQAQAQNTVLELSQSGDALVSGDRDELIQVVQNLIQNAVKYGKAGGRIKVALTADSNRVTLSVADDGIGIAPEHLPRLTERFYRVSAKASRDRGGTGLGLAIVKHIVNRHRGDLRIASRLGDGSTFSIVLPARRDGTPSK